MATRSARYKLELVEEIRRKLKALPAPTYDELSKIDLVRALAVDIAEQQKRGHSTHMIAALMAASGVAFTPSTLKTYLSKAKPARRRARTKRWRDSSENAAASTPPPSVAAGDDTSRAIAETPRGDEGDGNEKTKVQPRSDQAESAPEDAVAKEDETALTPRLKRRLQPVAGQPGSVTEPPVAREEGTLSTRRLQTEESAESTAVPESGSAGASAGGEKKLQRRETRRLTSGSSDLVSEKDEPVPHRLMAGEIDKSRSTFVPREDSRDI
jgi:hypothetical protein